MSAAKTVHAGTSTGDDGIDVVFTGSGHGHGHGVFKMTPRTDIPSGLTWDLVNLTPFAGYMKYDNLRLVDMDTEGDLDILTTEEGWGFFTSGIISSAPSVSNSVPISSSSS